VVSALWFPWPVSSWEGEPLPPGFLERPADTVAPELLGSLLHRALGDERIVLRISEVEGYAGTADPASHAYRGPTPRNAVMFGPAGHAYVYFVYGMHHALNIVCGPDGHAAAVLVRAGRVVHGLDVVRRHLAGPLAEARVASGPGRLTRAMAVDRALDGADLRDADSVLTLRLGAPVDPAVIRTGPRVGVTRAADRPWRFWLDGDPTVSPYRAYTPRRRATVEPVRAAGA
jgi:DNA-3-methyladenine glycosylase